MTSPEEWQPGWRNRGADGPRGFAWGFRFARAVGGPGRWTPVAVASAQPSSSSFWGHFRVRRSPDPCQPSPHGFGSH